MKNPVHIIRERETLFFRYVSFYRAYDTFTNGIYFKFVSVTISFHSLVTIGRR